MRILSGGSVLLVWAVVLPLGCATLPSQTNQSLLATRITASGLKQFEVSFPRPQINNRLHENNVRDKHPRREALIARMETIVEESGYCREGYLLLGRHAGETTYRLRGECRETASEADRQQFPDTIERW